MLGVSVQVWLVLVGWDTGGDANIPDEVASPVSPVWDVPAIHFHVTIFSL